MRHWKLAALLTGIATGLPATAMAEAPATLPVQGTLADSNGMPLTGAYTIIFRIYDAPTGGNELFTESLSVTVVQGAFTIMLGKTQTLDLTIFRNGPTYLGMKVGADDEMTPRLEFGSVPYAAHADNGVPPGAVMHFDLATCPAGWSELTGGRGRVLVGLPSGGTLGGTVGTALSDQENRSHTHTVGPVNNITSSTAGAHTHTVSGTTGSTAVPHRHQWLSVSTFQCAPGITCANWHSFLSSTVGSASSVVTASTGNQSDLQSSIRAFATSGTPTIFTGDTVQSTAHTHSFSATSSSAGNHNHTTTFPQTGSSAATTADVIPYMQLLVCRKD